MSHSPLRQAGSAIGVAIGVAIGGRQYLLTDAYLRTLNCDTLRRHLEATPKALAHPEEQARLQGYLKRRQRVEDAFSAPWWKLGHLRRWLYRPE